MWHAESRTRLLDGSQLAVSSATACWMHDWNMHALHMLLLRQIACLRHEVCTCTLIPCEALHEQQGAVQSQARLAKITQQISAEPQAHSARAHVAVTRFA